MIGTSHGTKLVFLSTLSLRRATSFRLRGISQNHISIHALLAESDCCAKIQNYNSEAFLSTLSLRRATLFLRSVCFVILPFLSTLSLRRATIIASIGDGAFQDFYPRSPCGERQRYIANHRAAHPFLSTLSLRRATLSCGLCRTLTRHFYPRSPCGERPSRAVDG